MTDHIVDLPSSISPDLRAAISTLALAGSFASPSHASAATLESDLLVKFSAQSSLDVASVLAWLETSGMNYQDLAPLVAQLPGNVLPLHTALQTAITSGGIVLLQVADASKLLDAAVTDVTALPVSLHVGDTSPVWILRTGFSDSNDYGVYMDLAAYGHAQPVQIMWASIQDAGILAAIALNAPVPPAPPKPPLDLVAIGDDLHLVEQAMEAATHAIANIRVLLELA